VIDLALPRTEFALKNNQGGYREFSVQSQKNLSIEKDLSRRDFTINAMAYNLRSKKLLDPFLGQMDLKNKKIHLVGDPNKRLKEDYTRILRAIRFSCELHFTLDQSTQKILKIYMPLIHKKRHGSFIVSQEMLARKFLKSFLADPSLTLFFYEKLGGMKFFFPAYLLLSSKQKRDLKKILVFLTKQKTPFCVLLTALLFFIHPTNKQNAFLKKLSLSGFPSSSPIFVHKKEILSLLSSFTFILKHDPSTIPLWHFESLFLSKSSYFLWPLLKAFQKVGSKKEQKMQEQKNQTIQKRIRLIYKKTKTRRGDPIYPLIDGRDILHLFPNLSGILVGKILLKVREKQLEGSIFLIDPLEKNVMMFEPFYFKEGG
jgi:tRNA nucleotidyltransferase/poly(A) polymerase